MGVVLDVSLREVLRRLVPAALLEQVPHDVQDDLLVGVELRVRAGEQGFRVGRAGHRLLGGDGRTQETARDSDDEKGPLHPANHH